VDFLGNFTSALGSRLYVVLGSDENVRKILQDADMVTAEYPRLSKGQTMNPSR
jgi:hypothetical protein